MQNPISTKIAARRVLAGLVIACCLGAADARAEGGTVLPKECAAKDLEVLTLIEKHDQDQDVPADRLAMAMTALMTARKICTEGRMEAALAVYDLINPTVILAHNQSPAR